MIDDLKLIAGMREVLKVYTAPIYLCNVAILVDGSGPDVVDRWLTTDFGTAYNPLTATLLVRCMGNTQLAAKLNLPPLSWDPSRAEHDALRLAYLDSVEARLRADTFYPESPTFQGPSDV